MTIYPVLIDVPHAPDEKPPERMRKQRDYARRALRHCATLTGAPLNGWSQQEGGAPLPNGEFYWSISHTRGLAAAVIAKTPVGIDVERIRERRGDLFDEVGVEEEWKLLGGKTWSAFFMLWTAKESVVKANSLGIGQLDECRLTHLGRDPHVSERPNPEPKASVCADVWSQGCYDPKSNASTPPDIDTATISFRSVTWFVQHRHIDANHIAAIAMTEPHRVAWSPHP
jgi:phosphopantetheinyl transferase